MKKLLFLLGLLAITPAQAADNALVVTPGSGVTMRTIDVGSLVQAGTSVPVGVNGASAWGTAGTANANILTVQGIASMTPLLVTATQSGAWTVAPTSAPAWGINTLGSTTAGQSGQLALGAVTTAAPTYTTAQSNALSLDTTGALRVNVTAGATGGGAVTIASGADATAGTTADTACATDTGTCTIVSLLKRNNQNVSSTANVVVTNANTNGLASQANSAPVVVAPVPSSTGNIVANNTTAVVVKASAGTLYGVQVYGIGAAPAYLKIYNATSATCGSGTPLKRIMIPAASTAANGAGSNVTFGPGISLSTGITYCVTTGITDADATAPAASTYLVNIDWQ